MAVSDLSRGATGLHPKPDRDADATSLGGIAAGARREVGATLATVRSSAGDVGERVPELLQTARTAAAGGARTIRTWPEPTQRLVAAFSLGFAAGLLVAGAPRLLVAGALAPAIGIAASTLGLEPMAARRPV